MGYYNISERELGNLVLGFKKKYGRFPRMGKEYTSRLSPREAAQALEMRLDSLYPLIWAGRLDARKVDGRWLVSKSAVRRMRDERIKRGKIHA